MSSTVLFFIGRYKELDKMKSIRDKYGSIAIMQHGGAGKTQLAAAFAAGAERNDWVPGESYWIRLGGTRIEVIDYIAEFTESLISRPLREKDRIDLRALTSELDGVFLSAQARWLHCLDNSDDQTVNPILSELSSLAKSTIGWVVVTSRQGSETLWPEMVSEQRHCLESLGSSYDGFVQIERKISARSY